MQQGKSGDDASDQDLPGTGDEAGAEVQGVTGLNAPGAEAGRSWVAAGVPCVGCGYNLFSQPSDGTCPECGASVRDSLDEGRLVTSPGWWLRRVYAGASLLGAAPVLAVLSVLSLGLASDMDFAWLGRTAVAGGIGLLLFGLVLATIALQVNRIDAARPRAWWRPPALGWLALAATLVTLVSMAAVATEHVSGESEAWRILAVLYGWVMPAGVATVGAWAFATVPPTQDVARWGLAARWLLRLSVVVVWVPTVAWLLDVVLGEPGTEWSWTEWWWDRVFIAGCGAGLVSYGLVAGELLNRAGRWFEGWMAYVAAWAMAGSFAALCVVMWEPEMLRPGDGIWGRLAFGLYWSMWLAAVGLTLGTLVRCTRAVERVRKERQKMFDRPGWTE